MVYIDMNGVFSKVVLKSQSRDVPKDINLYKPVRNKVYFHQLKVSGQLAADCDLVYVILVIYHRVTSFRGLRIYLQKPKNI